MIFSAITSRLRAAFSWLFAGFYARELTGKERDSALSTMFDQPQEDAPQVEFRLPLTTHK